MADSPGAALPVHPDAELADLHRAEFQFIDHVSHEFRTPLTVIKEFVTILRDGLGGPVNDQQRDYLAIIDDRADDLAIMVDDMLDLGKFEAGLLRLWRRKSKVDALFGQVLPALGRKAGIKKVNAAAAIEPGLPDVYCDPDKIARVLVSLGTQAIRRCAEGATVTFWARFTPDDEDVAIGVSSEGAARFAAPGEPGKVVATSDAAPSPNGNRTPKSRHAKSRRRRAPENTMGLGLGLTIAHELVGLHFGRFAVEDESDRGGSFSLTLPVWNPARLLRAHVERLWRKSDAGDRLVLFEVSTRRTIKPQATGVIDEFLQHVLEPDDLVLQVGKHVWLGAIARGDQDVDRSLASLRDAWAEVVHDRSGGLLPRIELRPLGQWKSGTDADRIIERFDSWQAGRADEPGAPTILVVEDDAQMRRGLEIQLAAVGFAVLAAGDGQRAIELAVAHRPDAILMDNYMPVLDGLTALDRLRQRDQTRDIPVIVLSAGLRDEQRALDLGARFFLQKPCDVQTIVAALGEAIELPFAAPK
ncbi:MAG: response regulator [Pirellulales bacterium]|nr:response regulator [Pirellulales bacterium]